MTTWIALLRGINVGRTRSLPMATLVALLQALGATDVRTLIQSGNVVFRHADATGLATALRSAIERRCGFAPDVQVFAADRLRSAIADNPFPEADAAPATVHVCFLAGTVDRARLDALAPLRCAGERYELVGDRLYLHTPDGIGRSRLASRLEAVLDVPVTARNWRTVVKLLALAEA